jgi:hypothetical protein
VRVSDVSVSGEVSIRSDAVLLAGPLLALRGRPAFAGRHVITTHADAAYSVFASDVDGDGDTDVLSASRDDDTIAWYENVSFGVSLFEPNAVLQAETDMYLVNKSVSVGPTNELAAGGMLSIDRTSELTGSGVASADEVRSAGTIAPDPAAVLMLDADYAQS